MNSRIIFGLLLLVVIINYLRIEDSKKLTTLKQDVIKEKNSTNIGFVKPENRLLKLFSNISSGKKIKLYGDCNRFVYHRNTIDKSVNDSLTDILKRMINTLNKVNISDFYVKNIENVYGLIDCKGNQRYIIDFFIYDIKNFYTIRLVTDIVIIDGETYINYLNVQTGSNSTILNRYDVKFNSSGILLDSNMFHENIGNLFDNYYMNSFKVVGVSDTNLEFNKEDLNDVYCLGSLENMYLPSNLSESSINEINSKGLGGYLEMYLPENQPTIKDPSFCNKYKIEWDSYGNPSNDNSDENCYVNNNSTTGEITQPYFAPGVIYERSSNDKYQWLKNVSRGNIMRSQGY
jgi:hypothetical protein